MKKNGKYFDLAMAALALVAFIMIFVPALTVRDEAMNGLDVTFGYSETTETFLGEYTFTLFEFSFMNLLTYVLAALTFVCALMAYKNTLLTLAGSALAVLSGVFFLLTKSGQEDMASGATVFVNCTTAYKAFGTPDEALGLYKRA